MRATPACVLSPQPFRLESEMLSSIRLCLPSLLALLNHSTATFLWKAAVGNVVPDLLAGVFDDDFCARKRPVTNVEAHVLALIEQYGELSEEEVRTRLHLSDSGAFRAFTRLKRSGMVQLEQTGNLVLGENSWLDGVQIAAFEVKLRRWTDALEQAESYLTFADRSYVVLDGAQITITSRVLQRFAETSVGLILQWGDRFEAVCAARRVMSLTPERIVAIQKLCCEGISLLRGPIQTSA